MGPGNFMIGLPKSKIALQCPFTISIFMAIYLVAINFKKRKKNKGNKKQVNHGVILP
jgi:hypothetical protein